LADEHGAQRSHRYGLPSRGQAKAGLVREVPARRWSGTGLSRLTFVTGIPHDASRSTQISVEPSTPGDEPTSSDLLRHRTVCLRRSKNRARGDRARARRRLGRWGTRWLGSSISCSAWSRIRTRQLGGCSRSSDSASISEVLWRSRSGHNAGHSILTDRCTADLCGWHALRRARRAVRQEPKQEIHARLHVSQPLLAL
jgi:hypothetical protein